MSVQSSILWVAFVLFILLLLALDLGVFHRGGREMRLREAAAWSAGWVAVGLSFTGVVYAVYAHGFGETLPGVSGRAAGLEAAFAYVTAYVVEKSLSVDNLFVMAVVFDGFRVPAAQRHRVLFWGIAGALVMRALMIGAGLWLLRFQWVFYVFGVYLVVTGWKLLRSGEDETDDPSSGRLVRWLRRRVPMTDDFRGGRFVVRERQSSGALRWRATPLLLVLLVIEWTDVVFALDSIPAVLAVSTESFIVFTSNVFAILGLRSLYFVLEAMVAAFHHLKHALALVLVFVGGKMLLHDVVHVPNLLSLAVIVSMVAGGVVLSLRADPRLESEPP